MQVEELAQKINAFLPDAEVFIRDLTGEGNHFEAFVVADAFAGKSRLERHKMVIEPLGSLLRSGSGANPEEAHGEPALHALTIKTYTREDWAKAQDI